MPSSIRLAVLFDRPSVTSYEPFAVFYPQQVSRGNYGSFAVAPNRNYSAISITLANLDGSAAYSCSFNIETPVAPSDPNAFIGIPSQVAYGELLGLL